VGEGCLDEGKEFGNDSSRIVSVHLLVISPNFKLAQKVWRQFLNTGSPGKTA